MTFKTELFGIKSAFITTVILIHKKSCYKTYKQRKGNEFSL